MSVSSLVSFVLLAAVLGVPPRTEPAAAGQATAPVARAADSRTRLALTFDDLPSHAPLPPGVTRTDVVRAILAALAAHHAPPTYGLVNGQALEREPGSEEVLRLWRAAGHLLGNHTFSHMDLHANSVSAFEQDVLRDEPLLRAHMGDEGWRFFRYPYLHEGETLEKRQAVARFLKDRGYRVAQVTANFDDWAFNEPYARCAAKGDEAAIGWMKERFRSRAAASFPAARENARRVSGRDLPQVLLLHLGAFDSVMLPKLLDLLDEQGFRLATLDEVESDPAFAFESDRPFPGGATLLDEMAAVKGVELVRTSDDTLERLDGLCR